MVGGKSKTTDGDKYLAKKAAVVGGRVAGLLIALGLMAVGAIFVIAGFTGNRPIAALIFGGLCELGGLAIIVSLGISLFQKKPRDNAAAR